jgi:flagellar operon protein
MIDHVKLAPLQSVSAGTRVPQPTASVPKSSFSDVLAEARRAQATLRFSAHAAQRLRERDITLSETEQAALQEGVERAAAKGSRETLLLTEDAAFVVSVANRTVITAVSRSEMGEAVFTNIDSAVVVDASAARN